MSGRPREHASNAARQAAYRERVRYNATALKQVVDALTLALDDGRCSWLVDRLPDNEAGAAEELVTRLSGVRLVAHRRQSF